MAPTRSIFCASCSLPFLITRIEIVEVAKLKNIKKSDEIKKVSDNVKLELSGSAELTTNEFAAVATKALAPSVNRGAEFA